MKPCSWKPRSPTASRKKPSRKPTFGSCQPALSDPMPKPTPPTPSRCSKASIRCSIARIPARPIGSNATCCRWFWRCAGAESASILRRRNALVSNYYKSGTVSSPSCPKSLVQMSAWLRLVAQNVLAETFDQQKIKYPRTEKGNPSFTAGTIGWMHKHPHWLPQLVVKADKYNNAAVNFLEKYILGHAVHARVHAEIHPHRSDEGGTRSLRFSYSNPPLQLMPAHDEELAPLIRGVFLPEEGEIWAKPDVSQQEFRFIVHYAARYKLPKARAAVERYRSDPETDFHNLVVMLTG